MVSFSQLNYPAVQRVKITILTKLYVYTNTNIGCATILYVLCTHPLDLRSNTLGSAYTPIGFALWSFWICDPFLVIYRTGYFPYQSQRHDHDETNLSNLRLAMLLNHSSYIIPYNMWNSGGRKKILLFLRDINS